MRVARRCGFTLLEIMIAMLLVSLVVLIVAQAFGISIDAWERGSRQAHSIQVRQVAPTLLAKQLQAVTADNLFNPAMGDFRQRFCGEADRISFLTAYSPMGSRLQGLQRVTWRYAEEARQLEIYQQVITHPDDLEDEFNPLAGQWQESFDPLSRFDQITAFELQFTGEANFEIDNTDHWRSDWECGDTLEDPSRSDIPVAVMLHIEAGRPPLATPPIWVLRVGTH